MRTKRPVVKFIPDRPQKIAAIRDVFYEYRNLMMAGYYSMRGSAPWRTNCDDAFLLGCRKVGDFLMDDTRLTYNGKELDDVLAIDFLPSTASRSWSVPIWNTEWRDAMHKQSAHIAYTRTKGWNHTKWVPQLQAEFNKAWWDFRDAVTDLDYVQEFDKYLQLAEASAELKGIPLRRM
jgi:hypothetical protein